MDGDHRRPEFLSFALERSATGLAGGEGDKGTSPSPVIPLTAPVLVGEHLRLAIRATFHRPCENVSFHIVEERDNGTVVTTLYQSQRNHQDGVAEGRDGITAPTVGWLPVDDPATSHLSSPVRHVATLAYRPSLAAPHAIRMTARALSVPDGHAMSCTAVWSFHVRLPLTLRMRRVDVLREVMKITDNKAVATTTSSVTSPRSLLEVRLQNELPTLLEATLRGEGIPRGEHGERGEYAPTVTTHHKLRVGEAWHEVFREEEHQSITSMVVSYQAAQGQHWVLVAKAPGSSGDVVTLCGEVVVDPVAKEGNHDTSTSTSNTSTHRKVTHQMKIQHRRLRPFRVRVTVSATGQTPRMVLRLPSEGVVTALGVLEHPLPALGPGERHVVDVTCVASAVGKHQLTGLVVVSEEERGERGRWLASMPRLVLWIGEEES